MADNKQPEPNTSINLTRVSGRKVEFDYLRAFAVTLVLFHHAVAAYTTFATINFENPVVTASPVVNELRWVLFDLFVAYNETFFMPLLFFISGLFIWRSMATKGVRRYLKSRLIRLGLPFIIGVVFLIPLAYYPALLQVGQITGRMMSYGAFWLGMIRSGFGTAGPLWFLSLLLAFNCLATLLYRFNSLPEDFSTGRSNIILGHSTAFFGVILGISIVVYIPVALIVGPLKWIGIGPFHAQAGRILLYLVYFLAGSAVGARGFDRTIFRSDGPLSRRWWIWLAVGLISFIVFIVTLVGFTDMGRTIVSELSFVVCCGANVFGMTGLFLKFAKRRIGILDSLSDNSYGIYIVHFVFVTWLQYLLLKSNIAPSVKGFIVFLATLILSWGVVAVIRSIPVVKKVI